VHPYALGCLTLYLSFVALVCFEDPLLCCLFSGSKVLCFVSLSCSNNLLLNCLERLMPRLCLAAPVQVEGVLLASHKAKLCPGLEQCRSLAPSRARRAMVHVRAKGKAGMEGGLEESKQSWLQLWVGKRLKHALPVAYERSSCIWQVIC